MNRPPVSLLVVLVILLPLGATPQESTPEQEIAALCRETLCRSPRTIRLRLKDGRFFEMTTHGRVPIVTGGFVTI